MAISIICRCGRALKAYDEMAGTRVKCPGCGAPLPVPNESTKDRNLAFAADIDSQPSPSPARRIDETKPIPLAPHGLALLTNAQFHRRDSESPNETAPHRKLHWLLVLALIPLLLSALRSGDESLRVRLDRTLVNALPSARMRANVLRESEDAKLDDVLAALPNGRVEGAHLPRGSKMHWLYAALAMCLFLGFLMVISTQTDADSLHLAGICLALATIGILFLSLIQFITAWTQEMIPESRGAALVLLRIANFIGAAPDAATNSRQTFFLNFLGFACGVGFCEELGKAMPLLVHFRRRATLSWRGAYLWGLASGAGFGISEGIIFGNQYNGAATMNGYLVHFISCVALQAVWSGSVALTLYRRQELIQGQIEWYAFLPALVRILGVALILHGLFHTFLKKEMETPALTVAAISFLWLAWQMKKTSDDDQIARAI